jgi:hypothetical protein
MLWHYQLVMLASEYLLNILMRCNSLLTYLVDNLAELYAPNLGFGYANLAAVL